MYSQRSCLSSNGGSRENSLDNNSSIENVWNYCPSEIPMESMGFEEVPEKVGEFLESQSIASKPTTAVGNSQCRLNMPAPKWNFDMSRTSKSKNEKANRFNLRNSAIENDLNYNAACLKAKENNRDIIKNSQIPTMTDKVMVGMKSFSEREIKQDTTSTHHDDKSIDDDFMIGHLTKAERAAKVKKYLEK